MTNGLVDWLRPRFQEGGGTPSVFFAVFGNFGPQFPPVSSARYRTAGLPASVGVHYYGATEMPPLHQLIQKLGRTTMLRQTELIDIACQSPSACLFRGDVADDRTLNYLRDVIGLVMCRLETGGAAVCDMNSFGLYAPQDWAQAMFARSEAEPTESVTIMASEEAQGTWFHTRGMLTFGRPDLSLRAIQPPWRQAGLDLINRFIEFQAQGAVVPDGQPVFMRGVPDGLVCRHRGSREDPAFNNVHISIEPA